MKRKPKVDPYKKLGIPKDADAAAIKRAYRKKAKAAHPDAGGSAEQFAELAAAHALLIDPVKRLQYDRTGAADEGPSQVEATAMSMIAGLLDKAMQAETDKWHSDLVDDMRKELAAGKADTKRQLDQVKRRIIRAERMATKFKVKKGANLLFQMARHRIGEMQATVAKGEEHVAAIDRAVQMLADQSFDADPMPKRPPSGDYILMKFVSL